MGATFKAIRNERAARLASIPLLSFDEFRQAVVDEVEGGSRISALFCMPDGADRLRLMAVLSSDIEGVLKLSSCHVGGSYKALTPDCKQAHWFEREIAEQWGVVPEGHPWLKPIRFHKSRRDGHDAWGRASSDPIAPGVADYFKMEGEEVHEVAVGPVHAGVIEPGHFRFQCHGETVYSLEISLGYQHRGAELSIVSSPAKRSLPIVETLAGDSSIAHAMAHCQALEALSGIEAPPRAQAIRALALELERLANHVGDLGALAGDVAFLPTQSYCGRLRGDYLNMSALICGNRFGRGLVRQGGVRFDVEPERASELLARLAKVFPETENAVDLLWSTPSVLERFEGTGPITKDICEDFGVVGVPARATGIERDVRFDHPYGYYRFSQIHVSTSVEGDVFARAYVRSQEIRRSASFVKDTLETLPGGPLVCGSVLPLAPESLAVSLVEGWRGEVCHVAATGGDGRLSFYKAVDPSFHNWFALALALRGEQVSNFPICNKSFNLSYCGHDL